MAENKDKSNKPGSKAGENVLGLLGTLGGLAGQIFFGPDFQGDLGAPFKMGAAEMASSRMEGDLLKYLNSTKATQPIAQMAPALMQAGGLVNNIDLIDHPEVAQAFGLQSGSPITTPDGSQPASDNSALQARILGDHPELLKSMGGADPVAQAKEMLQLQLLGKQVENFESPEERRQARQDERHSNMEMMDALIRGRQTDQTKLTKSYLSTAQTDKLSGIDTAYNLIRSLPDQAPAASTISNMAGNVPIVGKYAISALNPEFAQYDKQAKEAQAKLAFSSGGKNLTGIEKELTFGTQPSFAEHPEFYPQIKKNFESRINLVNLSELSAMAKAGKDVSEYIEPQQLEDYKVWQQILKKQGNKAFDDPDVLQLMDSLGISGLILPSQLKK